MSWVWVRPIHCQCDLYRDSKYSACKLNTEYSVISQENSVTGILYKFFSLHRGFKQVKLRVYVYIIMYEQLMTTKNMVTFP